MDTTRPLPARELPLPGESLASLLRRTSNAMGYENVGRLLALLPDRASIPSNVDHWSSGTAVDSLSCLLRTPPGALRKLTLHRYASALVLSNDGHLRPEVCDRKTILRYFATTSRICPRCLHQDSTPYARMIWSFRPLSICTQHATLLIACCPACGRRSRLNLNSRCRCGQDLREVETVAIPSKAVKLSQQVEKWLSTQESPLTEMSTAACFWWMERIAKAATKTPTWMRRVAHDLELDFDVSNESLAWLAAAQTLMNWPEQLEEFLEEFQRVPKYGQTSTGIGRSFGLLLRHASQLEQEGFSPPADALRNFLLRRYTLGSLTKKICLFKSANSEVLTTRTWMTQTKAAKFLRLRHGAIAQLIGQGVLVGEIHQAGQCGRSIGLVSRDSVDQLKLELQTAVGTTEAANRLGISRHRVLDLIHAGLLPRTVHTSQGWRIPESAIRSVESIYQSLRTVKRIKPGWLTARSATREFGHAGLTIANLLQQIQLERVHPQRLETVNGLAGLLILKTDLKRVMSDISLQHLESAGYPLNRLAKLLFPVRPMKETILKKWIQMGLLSSTRVGRAQIVTSDEVKRFRLEYCLYTSACDRLGISRGTLARWESEERIRPVYGRRVTPGAGFSLYRIADIEQLVAERAAGRFRRAA